MKKNNFLLSSLLLVVILILSGCGNKGGETRPTQPVSATPPMPTEVVEIYMKHTLGTIPGAEIDYEKAKEYLSADLKTRFTTPMFVPASYCIQDGPDDVRIVSDEPAAGNIEIVVEGQYGGEWQKMWQFSVVPIGDLSWAISEIKCLNI